MDEMPFDDRDGFIWLDGALVPWRQAQVHILTHALHYASCVFEGQRQYNGKIFKLTEHSARLLHSAQRLGFEIPYTLQEIDDAAIATAAANNLVDGYIRPLAWRGSETMGVSAQAAKIHMAIACWAWPSYYAPEARLKGLRLDMAEWRRPSPETAPTDAKAAGLYMICTLSKHMAEAKGYDDALMLDYRGRVAETTGANVFFIKDGVVHTPTPDCFLDGITRRTVIGLIKEHGVKLVERAIMPDELESFEQAFLTGTAAEVTPISEIGPYRFETGEFIRRLMSDYENLVQNHAPSARLTPEVRTTDA